MTLFDHFDPELDHHKYHLSCIRRLLTSSLGAPQEMQRSAAEARNKNRSAICFDYEPEPRAAPEAPKAKASKASKEAKVPKVPKVKAEEVKAGDLEAGRSGRSGRVHG